MNQNFKAGLATAAFFATTHALAQITFYENEGYRGQAFTTDRPIWNLERYGFNDSASSVIIDRGRWEVCESSRFEGRCVVLRPGSYDSLRRMGMNNRISSVRPIDGNRNYSDYREPEPSGEPYDAYRRRPDERLFEVPVTSVRAVVGPPEQRCWVERGQAGASVGGDNGSVGGAIAGAVIGGILGHQVGGGTGRDVATAGGAVAGAAIGSNLGRNYGNNPPRDVRRCTNVPGGPPEYWDVTYEFRGVEHRIQTSAPPGRTILVNAQGEPRQ
jgi:uncharacterized protein YcfJ